MLTPSLGWLLSNSSLINVLEGADKLWDIIVIVVSGLGLSFNASSDLLLEELVLLWSNLLEDVRHHFFEALGFRGS